MARAAAQRSSLGTSEPATRPASPMCGTCCEKSLTCDRHVARYAVSRVLCMRGIEACSQSGMHNSSTVKTTVSTQGPSHVALWHVALRHVALWHVALWHVPLQHVALRHVALWHVAMTAAICPWMISRNSSWMAGSSLIFNLLNARCGVSL